MDDCHFVRFVTKVTFPFPDSERLPGTAMITADAVIDMLMNAKSTIQLN